MKTRYFKNNATTLQRRKTEDGHGFMLALTPELDPHVQGYLWSNSL